MGFNENAWIAKVKVAKTSEELRALLYEIPDDYNGSSTGPETTSDRDSTSNTQTGKTPGGSEKGSM